MGKDTQAITINFRRRRILSWQRCVIAYEKPITGINNNE